MSVMMQRFCTNVKQQFSNHTYSSNSDNALRVGGVHACFSHCMSNAMDGEFGGRSRVLNSYLLN